MNSKLWLSMRKRLIKQLKIKTIIEKEMTYQILMKNKSFKSLLINQKIGLQSWQINIFLLINLKKKKIIISNGRSMKNKRNKLYQKIISIRKIPLSLNKICQIFILLISKKYSYLNNMNPKKEKANILNPFNKIFRKMITEESSWQCKNLNRWQLKSSIKIMLFKLKWIKMLILII